MGALTQRVWEFAVINNQCLVNTENESTWRSQGFLLFPNPKRENCQLTYVTSKQSWAKLKRIYGDRQNDNQRKSDREKLKWRKRLQRVFAERIWKRWKWERKKKERNTWKAGSGLQEIPLSSSWPSLLVKKLEYDSPRPLSLLPHSFFLFSSCVRVSVLCSDD